MAFGGSTYQDDTNSEVCKRGKNKDSFGKKQYFFSNCWSDSSATRIFPAAM
jgi:hypothetical protein